MNTQKLVLVRGLPGSGKTTYAKTLGMDHFEADDYFASRPFNPKALGIAHAECQRNTWKALQAGRSVVVANTFTRVWEMMEYLHMASELGVSVEVVRMTGDYGSIHNVPPATIENMRKRWEDFSGEKVR